METNFQGIMEGIDGGCTGVRVPVGNSQSLKGLEGHPRPGNRRGASGSGSDRLSAAWPQRLGALHFFILVEQTNRFALPLYHLFRNDHFFDLLLRGNVVHHFEHHFLEDRS